MFAVYIAATVFGVLVLILALILLALLRWMNALAPLPSPDRLVLPQAGDFVAVMLRDVPRDPEGLADFLCEGAAPQVRNLVAKGLREPRCPVLIVASRMPGDEIPLAIGLGAYPGQFSLVRRDLERRLKRQGLDGSMTHHLGKTIFQVPTPQNDCDTLCLADCIVLRTEDTGTMRLLIERLASKPSAPVPGAPFWPRDAAAGIATVGRLGGWRAELLDRLPDALWADALRDLASKAAGTAPGLASCKSLAFQGESLPGGGGRVGIDIVAASDADAKEIASALGAFLPAAAERAGLGLHDLKVTLREETVSLAVTLGGDG